MIWHFWAAEISYKKKGYQSSHGADRKEKSYYKALFKLTCSSECSDVFRFIFPTLPQIFFIIMVMFGNSVKILKRHVCDGLTSSEFSLYEVGLDKIKTGGNKTQKEAGCHVGCLSWLLFS